MEIAWYVSLITPIGAMLAHLAGLVVAIILLVRVKGTPAILAAVGFALLTLISLAQIILRIPAVITSLYRGPRWIGWPLNCCCGLLDVAAVVCLIVAIWQAVAGANASTDE